MIAKVVPMQRDEQCGGAKEEMEVASPRRS